VLPACTLAVLITAPTPVKTAQPNNAASARGKPLSILTRDRRDKTAWSAKAETPKW
jgi:hypothetical protein